MMDSMTLRSYRHDDAAAVSELFRKIYGGHYAQPHVYLPCMIDRNHAQGRWHSLVAVVGDQLLGHASLIRAKGSSLAELALSVVDPESQGQNIASRLGERLLIHAEALGCKGVMIKSVTCHPYTQRMAASLGFHCTGWLPDYAPSPFVPSARESLVIGYTPVAGERHPIPLLKWPKGCRSFMERMCDVLGTKDTPAPWVGEPVHFEQRWNCFEGVIRKLDGDLLKQLRELPADWLISIRLRLAEDFDNAWQELTTSGFVFTGIAPDETGAGWLALFHRGARPPALRLNCPHMQRMHDDLQRQVTRLNGE
jgi:GNAT superfamily N-acetyltransferase